VPARESFSSRARLGPIESRESDGRAAFGQPPGRIDPRAAIVREGALRGHALAGEVPRFLSRTDSAGRFFGSGWRERRQPRPVLIAWAGPVFWPYAYEDLLGYTFYPYALGAFWPYAYDGLYAGMFPYAGGPVVIEMGVEPVQPVAPPNDPAAGPPAEDGRAQGPRQPFAARESVDGDFCGTDILVLADWPVGRIAQAIEPDEAQRLALGDLRQAIADALGTLKSRCFVATLSTAPARMELMRQRLALVLAAVRTVHTATQRLYGLLDDGQKARFNALSLPGAHRTAGLSSACTGRQSGIAGLPIAQIEQAVAPEERQRGALGALKEAAAAAADILPSDCKGEEQLMPLARLQTMEQRLDAMVRAIDIVEPAFNQFYRLLTDEQKQQLNRINLPIDDRQDAH
jgi:LTXXQ motif family protein